MQDNFKLDLLLREELPTCQDDRLALWKLSVACGV